MSKHGYSHFLSIYFILYPYISICPPVHVFMYSYTHHKTTSYHHTQHTQHITPSRYHITSHVTWLRHTTTAHNTWMHHITHSTPHTATSPLSRHRRICPSRPPTSPPTPSWRWRVESTQHWRKSVRHAGHCPQGCVLIIRTKQNEKWF